MSGRLFPPCLDNLVCFRWPHCPSLFLIRTHSLHSPMRSLLPDPWLQQRLLLVSTSSSSFKLTALSWAPSSRLHVNPPAPVFPTPRRPSILLPQLLLPQPSRAQEYLHSLFSPNWCTSHGERDPKLVIQAIQQPPSPCFEPLPRTHIAPCSILAIHSLTPLFSLSFRSRPGGFHLLRPTSSNYLPHTTQPQPLSSLLAVSPLWPPTSFLLQNTP